MKIKYRCGDVLNLNDERVLVLRVTQTEMTVAVCGKPELGELTVRMP